MLGAALEVAGGLRAARRRAPASASAPVILGVPPIAWVVLALLSFGPAGLSAGFTVLVTALPIVFAGALQA